MLVIEAQPRGILILGQPPNGEILNAFSYNALSQYFPIPVRSEMMMMVKNEC